MKMEVNKERETSRNRRIEEPKRGKTGTIEKNRLNCLTKASSV